MDQPSLFEGEYVKDKFIIGNRIPYLRHADHSVAAMRKPFVFWDGEGYTDQFGLHHYWLLANSLGDKVIAPPGRSIERWNVARLFHSVHARIPNGIHCGFALGYDYTMALRANGIAREQADGLRQKNLMVADGFVWRLMMGKMLTIWPEGAGNKGDKFVLNDVWGFFQRSFVKAMDEYFNADWPHRDEVIEMKAQRAFFDREHDEDVMRYNDQELELGVMLMEELRDRLFTAGMPVSRWYGPGAIANGLLQKWNAKSAMVDLYEDNPNVAAAAQYAYAGGRFELVKCGHINTAVYQYDINSAYPYALSQVPDLNNGEWVHSNDPDIESLPEFSMVRIRWTTNLSDDMRDYGDASLAEIYPRSIPFPLWRRTPKGTIQYPSHGVHGWYWLSEVRAAIAYGNSLPESFGFSYSLEESYSYHENSARRPYNTIPILYNTRIKLKQRGNGAHIGIKLGLNSLYGKFAQQIGYDDESKRVPPYHNLAIAGFVTAKCRSMMVEAMTHNPAAVIAFETDGIFTTSPLPLPIGTGLGQWDLTVYDDMWYYQSGFRFGILDGEVIKPATRGIPAKDISLTTIQAAITNALSTLELEQTQFITLQWAYSMNHPEMAGQWKTGTKTLRLMAENPVGKRYHDPDCYMCDVDSSGIRHYRNDMAHVTLPAEGYEGQLSEPHRVLWSELGGIREEPDYEVVIEP